MKLAQIIDGIVENVIIVDAENVPAWAENWPEAVGGDVGWSYDGETFSPPAQPSDAVLRAAWRAIADIDKGDFLFNLGVLGVLTEAEVLSASKGDWPPSFEAMLASVEGGLPALTALRIRVDWATISRVRRAHWFIPQLALAANLTDEQVDALFGYVAP